MCIDFKWFSTITLLTQMCNHSITDQSFWFLSMYQTVLLYMYQDVMSAGTQLDTSLAQRPGLGTPLNQSVLADRSINVSQRNTPIRPLTAAYKAASHDHQVSHTPIQPLQPRCLLHTVKRWRLLFHVHVFHTLLFHFMSHKCLSFLGKLLIVPSL